METDCTSRVQSLFNQAQIALKTIGQIHYRDSAWQELCNLASSHGFRGAYIGEDCAMYATRARRHVAAKFRDESFQVALKIAMDFPSVPVPPAQDEDPENNVKALQEWCIVAIRSAQTHHMGIPIDVPPLNQNDGQWVKNTVAAKMDGVESATLATYRTSGQISEDKMCGIDKDGRKWRKQGTPNAHPFYLRSSLKSQNKS
jgi:hypothetical protein